MTSSPLGEAQLDWLNDVADHRARHLITTRDQLGPRPTNPDTAAKFDDLLRALRSPAPFTTPTVRARRRTLSRDSHPKVLKNTFKSRSSDMASTESTRHNAINSFQVRCWGMSLMPNPMW